MRDRDPETFSLLPPHPTRRKEIQVHEEDAVCGGCDLLPYLAALGLGPFNALWDLQLPRRPLLFSVDPVIAAEVHLLQA